MTNREFIIWLLGYFQLCGGDRVDHRKLLIIKNHLNLVKAVDGTFTEVNAKIFEAVEEALKETASGAELLALHTTLKQTVLELERTSAFTALQA